MKSLGSLLSNFLHSIASNEEITLIFLNELWPEIVGKDLALNSRPLALKDKKLILAVPSEIWKKELLALRHMLIKAINEYWKLRLVEKIGLEIRLIDDSAD
ncbi:DUF721 domain-containing protein [Acidobacteria bacterium AH-259-G07]|nr:DUF721 domain-containing protein [Acidobacteria bacterium AH-259-G07]